MGTKKKGSTTESAELTLSGEQTIQKVGELKSRLLNALEETGQLVIKLQDVERADLTFLQLLCSAHRTAQRSGKQVAISNMSPAIEAAVVDAGFMRNNMACGQDCADSCLWMEN